MNKLNLKKITEELLQTFLDAGKVAKDKNVKGLKIIIKADKSPVTDGDLEVDKMLRKKISNITPNIPIISEETVDLKKKNDFKDFWLIDPIDGTRDYINKRDEYTLNASLIINLKPALGIVYAPAKDRLFFSYGMDLSFEISNGKTKKLNCDKKNKGEIVALANSDSTPREVLDIYKKNKVSKIIKMSSSLKFCIIATGEADIYAAKARAFEWDIAAGHAILKHAGGKVTDFQGNEILYGKEDFKNSSLIIKNKDII